MSAGASITAVDKGIVELKAAVSNMHAQVESLHRKVDKSVYHTHLRVYKLTSWYSLTEKASEALKLKRKPLALNHIRSRKSVQGLLDKRLGALENLESTLLTVEAAASDIEVSKTNVLGFL